MTSASTGAVPLTAAAAKFSVGEVVEIARVVSSGDATPRNKKQHGQHCVGKLGKVVSVGHDAGGAPFYKLESTDAEDESVRAERRVGFFLWSETELQRPFRTRKTADGKVEVMSNDGSWLPIVGSSTAHLKTDAAASGNQKRTA